MHVSFSAHDLAASDIERDACDSGRGIRGLIQRRQRYVFGRREPPQGMLCNYMLLPFE
jgi:hypothetical protein